MDVDGNFLDQDGTIYAADLATLHALTPPILLTELFDPSDEWGRENMTIGPEGPYGLTKPANAVAIGVYFSVLGTPLISNVQVEAAAEPTVFAYAPRLGTFEYEGSDEKYATIEQVDLNPANNGRVTGLLSIGIDINPDIDPELY